MGVRMQHLSRREQEVLCCIAAGLTNQQIAERLSISINTVKTHVKHIFCKVQATSRAEAIAVSIRLNLMLDSDDIGGLLTRSI